MTENSQDKQDGKRKAHSRWTDNPFRKPNLSPEQLEWLNKRDEATRIYHETGDDTMAIEIGLFPSREEEAEIESERHPRNDVDGAENSCD